MTTPVKFELAKLLKEKGFDEYVKLCVAEDDNRALPFDTGNSLHKNSLHPYYSAPTVAEVLMWLYEKYEIWISVKTIKWNYEHNIIRFNYNIVKFNDKNPSDITDVVYDFNSPTEAYEAAIIYILSKLI